MMASAAALVPLGERPVNVVRGAPGGPPAKPSPAALDLPAAGELPPGWCTSHTASGKQVWKHEQTNLVIDFAPKLLSDDGKHWRVQATLLPRSR